MAEICGFPNDVLAMARALRNTIQQEHVFAIHYEDVHQNEEERWIYSLVQQLIVLLHDSTTANDGEQVSKSIIIR